MSLLERLLLMAAWVLTWWWVILIIISQWTPVHYGKFIFAMTSTKVFDNSLRYSTIYIQLAFKRAWALLIHNREFWLVLFTSWLGLNYVWLRWLFFFALWLNAPFRPVYLHGSFFYYSDQTICKQEQWNIFYDQGLTMIAERINVFCWYTWLINTKMKRWRDEEIVSNTHEKRKRPVSLLSRPHLIFKGHGNCDWLATSSMCTIGIGSGSPEMILKISGLIMDGWNSSNWPCLLLNQLRWAPPLSQDPNQDKRYRKMCG